MPELPHHRPAPSAGRFAFPAGGPGVRNVIEQEQGMKPQQPTRRRFLDLRVPAALAMALGMGLWGASPSRAEPPDHDTAVGVVAEAPEISICQQGATHLLMEGDVVTYQLV